MPNLTKYQIFILKNPFILKIGYAHRGDKLWIRVFPDKPITMRPAETPMGSWPEL
jgi:hypothetical protein